MSASRLRFFDANCAVGPYRTRVFRFARTASELIEEMSFSNVEQGIKMNQKLDALMTSMALSQVDGVVGRTIVSADGTISGTVAALRVVSGGAVALLEDGRQVTLGAGVTIG